MRYFGSLGAASNSQTLATRGGIQAAVMALPPMNSDLEAAMIQNVDLVPDAYVTAAIKAVHNSALGKKDLAIRYATGFAVGAGVALVLSRLAR